MPVLLSFLKRGCMLSVRFEGAGFAKKRIADVAKRLKKVLVKLERSSLDSPFAFASLPSDGATIRSIDAAVSLKRALHPQLIVVVGIGGSNLGAQALVEALRPKTKVLFADTVDPDVLSRIIVQMQDVLRQGKNIVLNVVTKSGFTVETIANFEILYNVLARHRRNANEFVVATTDKGSKLWHLAFKRNFSVLEIPKNVGGRYSVFSAAGLFPLGLAGVDIRELLKGASFANRLCFSQKSPAAQAASWAFLNYRKGRTVYDHFFFASDLEGIGKWCRQLVAESLGKEFDLDGARKKVGILPTVSLGTTDLHSLGQLYFGGPDARFTQFVTSHFNEQLKLPSYADFNNLVPNIQKQDLSSIMRCVREGVLKSYRSAGLPYIEARLSKDEFSLGAFMQAKMLEVVLLAHLLNINPFDQPAVESYKRESSKLLAKKKL